MLLDLFEQLKQGQPQGVGDNLHSVECGIGLTTLKTAEVGLVEATLFTKDSLAHTSSLAQCAHTGAKLESKRGLHPEEYLRYALNRINTNSHNR